MDNVKSYEYLSTVYDRLMADVDYDKWAEYINGLLSKHKSGKLRIFEAGCGTGNISVRLKKHGHTITAADISEAMLDIAAKNARAEGADITFVLSDIRTLDQNIKYDAVIACCDVVNYLTVEEDLSRFFQSAYNMLKSGGLIAFDISSAHKLKDIIGNELFYEDTDDVTFLWQNSYDRKSECVEMDITLFLPSNNGYYRRFDETHVQRAYTVHKITDILTASGFKDIHAYSFLTDKPVRESDDRIQFTAVKGEQ